MFKVLNTNMKISDFQIHSTEELDQLLVTLIDMIVVGQRNDPENYGLVAAGVLDTDGRFVPALNYLNPETGRRVHAERAAADHYQSMHGEIPQGSIIITTLSPCTEDMSEREDDSCNELINNGPVKKVYCGYRDHTQQPDNNKTYHLRCTRNEMLNGACKRIAETFLK
jgi:pyrimidine deaminase RibD-like protein